MSAQFDELKSRIESLIASERQSYDADVIDIHKQHVDKISGLYGPPVGDFNIAQKKIYLSTYEAESAAFASYLHRLNVMSMVLMNYMKNDLPTDQLIYITEQVLVLTKFVGEGTKMQMENADSINQQWSDLLSDERESTFKAAAKASEIVSVAKSTPENLDVGVLKKALNELITALTRFIEEFKKHFEKIEEPVRAVTFKK